MLIQYIVQVRVHLHFTRTHGEDPVAFQVDTDVSTGQRSLALQRTGDQIGEVNSSDTHRVGLVTVTFKIYGWSVFVENIRVSRHTIFIFVVYNSA